MCNQGTCGAGGTCPPDGNRWHHVPGDCKHSLGVQDQDAAPRRRKPELRISPKTLCLMMRRRTVLSTPKATEGPRMTVQPRQGGIMCYSIQSYLL